jgi:hypothetical protein
MKDGTAAHAEWLCTHLATRLGIACPDCQILQMPDDTLVFGSRWEGGVVVSAPGSAVPLWVAMVKTGQIKLADIRTALSRIYAFDHFVHNYDRHAKNFLVRNQLNGHAVLAFDYSRAWTANGFPLPNLPFDIMDPNERTVNVQRALSNYWGLSYIDAAEAKKFLALARKVTRAQIREIIRGHPKSWLPPAVRTAILKWWGSKQMITRVDGIEKGIDNGTYL